MPVCCKVLIRRGVLKTYNTVTPSATRTFLTSRHEIKEDAAMLVLTRKLNESVYIDGDIEVMIVAVRGNKVRLGFRAPAEVSIQRKERALAIEHLHGDFHTDDEHPED